jgi:hypothetical protein
MDFKYGENIHHRERVLAARFFTQDLQLLEK